MQIIKTEGKYRVYGENIEVYDQFEPDFYQFMVDDNGPFVVKTTRPEINGKVYGSDQNKIAKCMKTYKEFNRSLGIMLVGNKGNGKTLFAKQMCINMINAGYPVINVNFYHPSLPTFMTQISQECVFLFDEFEKMFVHDEKRGSEQNEMLSTFDGINMTKKMFIITCNNVSNLSQYIYNRPGRFHYSFAFSEPKYDDIAEYMYDNINTEKCIESIDKIALFAYVNALNYDCLRSLVFELNNGYSLIDTFDDLNIGYNEDRLGSLNLMFTNGDRLVSKFSYTPFSNKCIRCELFQSKGWTRLGDCIFKVEDLKYSKEYGLYIDTKNIDIEWMNVSSIANQEVKDLILYYRNLTPNYMTVNFSVTEKNNPLRDDIEDEFRMMPNYYVDDVIYADDDKVCSSNPIGGAIIRKANKKIGFCTNSMKSSTN